MRGQWREIHMDEVDVIGEIMINMEMTAAKEVNSWGKEPRLEGHIFEYTGECTLTITFKPHVR